MAKEPSAGTSDLPQRIAAAGGLDRALASGSLAKVVDVSASEALVLGLLRQGVERFFVILGHGNTELGEVLRLYHEAGLVSVSAFRNEIEMTHAATALRWASGEQVAVVTSIGPGALQAMSATLTAGSNGVGVWHIYGDETTFDEGPNMQQIPGAAQGQFLKMLSTMGHAYQLHTPEAITECLRRGSMVTNHPTRPQPFFVLFPINVQPVRIEHFTLERLPMLPAVTPSLASPGSLDDGARVLQGAPKVVIKVGRGGKGFGRRILDLAESLDAAVVTSPSSVGVVPFSHPRVMGVGGSKGSIGGNFAMEHAETLVVIGSRAVCQSDCSRTGYPRVTQVVNINADVFDATHYNNTVAVVGDIGHAVAELTARLKPANAGESPWLAACRSAKAQWQALLDERTSGQGLSDAAWGRDVLGQPSVIRRVLEWAETAADKVFFDAGDVQANGFQLCTTDKEDWFYSDSGASYMGFGASAVLSGGLASAAFYSVALVGDGSFVMNPQSLIDAVHLGVKGCILILDNRRMAAISSLQTAQYGNDFATADFVEVDYAAWANAVKGVQGLFGGTSFAELDEALATARRFDGLSVIHVPVYFGDDERGGLGAYGRWNVGAWVDETQKLILSGRL